MLMNEMVDSGVRRFGAQTAIRFADEALTFAEAGAWANCIARALIATGHAPVGARIALLLNNGLYGIPLDFACAAARVCRVPLNARLSAREHAQMIAGAGARLLVFGPDLAERAHELGALVPGLELLCLGVDPAAPRPAYARPRRKRRRTRPHPAARRHRARALHLGDHRLAQGGVPHPGELGGGGDQHPAQSGFA